MCQSYMIIRYEHPWYGNFIANFAPIRKDKTSYYQVTFSDYYLVHFFNKNQNLRRIGIIIIVKSFQLSFLFLVGKLCLLGQTGKANFWWIVNLLTLQLLTLQVYCCRAGRRKTGNVIFLMRELFSE